MRHSPAHFQRLRILAVFAQQLCGAAHNGENVAVMPDQFHGRPGRFDGFSAFFSNGHHFKPLRLPEMDIQNTAIHFDIPLFKTFSPTVRVLSRDIFHHGIPLALRQVLTEGDDRTAAQFPIVHFDCGQDAGQFAPDLLRAIIICEQNRCVIGYKFPPVQVLDIVVRPLIRHKLRSKRRQQFDFSVFFYLAEPSL